MKAIELTPKLFGYLEDHAPLCHPILEKIADDTRKRSDAVMQISRSQGSFMNLMVKLLNVKTAVEVGCFTGYSTISVASALPVHGKLISFDIDPEAIEITRTYASNAGLENRIEFHCGPALQNMACLKEEVIDFAFIDADKGNMIPYYNKILENMKPGGVILADNVLWSGRVAEKNSLDEDTLALKEFNTYVKSDSRVNATMLNIADGIYFIVKG